MINTDSSNDTGDFYKFCQEQSYPLEDSFPHDQAVINKVTKYSGYGNGISLSFERSHFGQDVVYNQANDSLTIYKVPPNLKSQLLALIEEKTINNKSLKITIFSNALLFGVLVCINYQYVKFYWHKT